MTIFFDNFGWINCTLTDLKVSHVITHASEGEKINCNIQNNEVGIPDNLIMN